MEGDGNRFEGLLDHAGTWERELARLKPGYSTAMTSISMRASLGSRAA